MKRADQMNRGLEQIQGRALQAEVGGVACVASEEPDVLNTSLKREAISPGLEPSEIRYIRAKQVTQMLSISRSTLYDWTNPASKRYDPSFPKSTRLNKSTKHGAVFWLESDVLAWLKNCAFCGEV